MNIATQEATDVLIFLRVPKTGTSSLQGSYEGPKCMCRCMSYDDEAAHAAAIRAVHGPPCAERMAGCLQGCSAKGHSFGLLRKAPHASWADLESALTSHHGRPWRVHWLTLLREPVARVLSEYLHARFRLPNLCGGGHDALLPRVHGNVVQLPPGHDGLIFAWDYAARCNETLLQSVRANAAMHNRQTYMLGGVGSGNMAPTRKELDRAKARLEQTAWFGLTEQWALSLRMLRASLRGGTLAPFDEAFAPLLQQSSDEQEAARERASLAEQYTWLRAQPSYAQAVREITERNALDLELYAHASALLARRSNASAVPADAGSSSGSSIVQAGGLVAQLLESLPHSGTAGSEEVVGFGGAGHVTSETGGTCNLSAPSGASWFGTYDWYKSQHECAFRATAAEPPLYRTQLFQTTGGGSDMLPVRFYARVASVGLGAGLVTGQYVVVMGAAQTMGIMARDPFVSQLQRAVGMPVVPIGWGGAGAAFFVQLLSSGEQSALGVAVRHVVAHAAVVLVQAMSGRSVAYPGCSQLCYNRWCRRDQPGSDGSKLVDMEHEWTQLMARHADPEQRRQRLQAVETTWVRDHVALLKRARNLSSGQRAAIGFLYVSEAGRSVAATWRKFPQLVAPSWLDAVRSHADTYLDGSYQPKPLLVLPLGPRQCGDCVAARGQRQCYMGRLHECACGYFKNNYYPTDPEHAAIAEAVAPALRKMLQRQPALLPAAQIVMPAEHSVQVPDPSLPPAASTMRFHLIFTTNEASTVRLHTNQTVSGAFSLRNRIGLESILYHHPDAIVSVHSNTLPLETFADLRARGYQVHVRRYNLAELAAPGTVLGGAIDEGGVSKGWARHAWAGTASFWYSHQTDLLRLLFLYEEGGAYVDCDVVLTRPFSALRNVLGYQSARGVNGAVLIFDRHNEFLRECVGDFVRSYDPLMWSANGPNLLTRQLERFHDRPTLVRALPQAAFYAFGKGKTLHRDCFAGAPRKGLRRLIRHEAYAVHLNGRWVSQSMPDADSVCAELLSRFRLQESGFARLREWLTSAMGYVLSFGGEVDVDTSYAAHQIAETRKTAGVMIILLFLIAWGSRFCQRYC